MDCFLNEVENLLLETANPSRRARGGVWGGGHPTNTEGEENS